MYHSNTINITLINIINNLIKYKNVELRQESSLFITIRSEPPVNQKKITIVLVKYTQA